MHKALNEHWLSFLLHKSLGMASLGCMIPVSDLTETCLTTAPAMPEAQLFNSFANICYGQKLWVLAFWVFGVVLMSASILTEAHRQKGQRMDSVPCVCGRLQLAGDNSTNSNQSTWKKHYALEEECTLDLFQSFCKDSGMNPRVLDMFISMRKYQTLLQYDSATFALSPKM